MDDILPRISPSLVKLLELWSNVPPLDMVSPQLQQHKEASDLARPMTQRFNVASTSDQVLKTVVSSTALAGSLQVTKRFNVCMCGSMHRLVIAGSAAGGGALA